MSSIELMVAYRRERFPWLLYIPLAVLIFAAGSVATSVTPTAREAMFGVAIALLLVLAFRIADDLTDRGADRARTPGRITVRTAQLTPLFGMGAAASIAAIVFAAFLGSLTVRALWLGALVFVHTAWGLARRRAQPSSLAHAHVLLAKYPVIAVFACPDPARLTVADAVPALLALYLGFCVYEALDDPLVRSARGARPLMAVELAVLAGIQLFTLTRGVYSI